MRALLNGLHSSSVYHRGGNPNNRDDDGDKHPALNWRAQNDSNSNQLQSYVARGATKIGTAIFITLTIETGIANEAPHR